MSKRKKNGQFPKGKMGERRRRAISHGQQRRFDRLREQGQLQSWKTGDRKRCSKCKKMKWIPWDYSMRRRRLKSGGHRSYPAGECKACAAERTALWRKNKGRVEVGGSRVG